MSNEPRDYLEMTFRSIQCFSNDGQFRPDELEELLQIALRDGKIDDNEKRVLQNIFSRLTPEELTPEMKEKMEAVRNQFKIQ